MWEDADLLGGETDTEALSIAIDGYGAVNNAEAERLALERVETDCCPPGCSGNYPDCPLA
jgi:hypothetical protein